MSIVSKFLTKEAFSLARSGVRSLIKSTVKEKWLEMKQLSPADIEERITSDLGYLTTFYTVSKSQEIKYKLSSPFILEWLQNSPSLQGISIIKDEETGIIRYNGHPITNSEKMELVKLIATQTKNNSTTLMGYLNVALSLLEPTDFISNEFRKHFSGWDLNNTSIINQWVNGVFGIQDEFASLLWRKWIIGTARRITHPGSSLDGVIILRSGPGTGKTSFARTLLPPPFAERAAEIYCDIKNPQKFIENIVGKSIVNFDELSALQHTNTTEIFKQLISSQHITVRLPWRKAAERFDLRAGFIATTNKEKFITDPTLSRRLWTISLPADLKRINFNFLETNREALWKEALYWADQNEIVYLTPTEQAELEKRNLINLV